MENAFEYKHMKQNEFIVVNLILVPSRRAATDVCGPATDHNCNRRRLRGLQPPGRGHLVCRGPVRGRGRPGADHQLQHVAAAGRGRLRCPRVTDQEDRLPQPGLLRVHPAN